MAARTGGGVVVVSVVVTVSGADSTEVERVRAALVVLVGSGVVVATREEEEERTSSSSSSRPARREEEEDSSLFGREGGRGYTRAEVDRIRLLGFADVAEFEAVTRVQSDLLVAGGGKPIKNPFFFFNADRDRTGQSIATYREQVQQAATEAEDAAIRAHLGDCDPGTDAGTPLVRARWRIRGRWRLGQATCAEVLAIDPNDRDALNAFADATEARARGSVGLDIAQQMKKKMKSSSLDHINYPV